LANGMVPLGGQKIQLGMSGKSQLVRGNFRYKTAANNKVDLRRVRGGFRARGSALLQPNVGGGGGGGRAPRGINESKGKAEDTGKQWGGGVPR